MKLTCVLIIRFSIWAKESMLLILSLELQVLFILNVYDEINGVVFCICCLLFIFSYFCYVSMKMVTKLLNIWHCKLNVLGLSTWQNSTCLKCTFLNFRNLFYRIPLLQLQIGSIHMSMNKRQIKPAACN